MDTSFNRQTIQALRPERQKSAPRYHPRFNDPKADRIIISGENTYFRVSSSVLERICHCLRPYHSGVIPVIMEDKATIRARPIKVKAKDGALEKVLDMIKYDFARYQPQWKSLIELQEAVDLAVMWNARSLLSTIRASGVVMSPQYLKADPIRVYAIVSNARWNEEQDRARKHCLAASID